MRRTTGALENEGSATVYGYGTSLLLTVVAYALQRAIWPYIPPSPQLLFYPAVFLAGRWGGFGPGLLATVASALAIAHGFLPPRGNLGVMQSDDMLDLAIFVGVGSGMSAVLGRLRAALACEREATRKAQLAKKATDETWEMMAHDLRGPLSVITLSSEQLGQLRKGAPDVEHAVGAIRRSTMRARDLVQEAVDAMHLEDGSLVISAAPRRIASLVDEAVESVAPMARQKGVALVVELAEGQVLCDGGRVVQVLTNLLGNAIKFTPAGGRATLAVSSRDEKVHFVVADTGPGIPRDELPSVFSKYWTRDRRAGFGLGLWIARTIVEAHGATLAVSSALGEGTQFSFDLPHGARSAEAVSPTDQPAPSVWSRPSTQR